MLNNGKYENNSFIAEECDDGNTNNGDGCSNQGLIETINGVKFTCINVLG